MDPHTARLRYDGTGGSLFGLMFVNAFLTGITLGIYTAWAKNTVRVFHWSHTELDGDGFAYHGTGGELFSGYLKAGLIMLGLSLAFTALISTFGGGSAPPAAQFGLPIALYVTVLILIIYAVNSARRYRLSRSSWRGIRFSFHGAGDEFFMLMVRGTLLTILTLSLYTPFFQNQWRAFFVHNARFGSEPFSYDGESGPLFREYIKALLLTIPTIGLSWFWYAAFKHRYFWKHTAMRGARFQSTVTAGALLRVVATNCLLVIVTLGIGAPWAIARMHRFWCDHLSLVGTVDWASIQQRAQRASGIGEGLAEGFDVDVALGM